MTITMAEKLTEQETKLVNQIEYYFGDVNLIKDKFMKEEIAKNDGWMPLETLLTFNKLKAMNVNDSDVIEAFGKVNSDLIEVNADEKQIRRSKPLPEVTEEYVRQLRLRTVHLKGFPLDSKFEDIHEFCAQYGEIESLEMRRTKERNFKGCCFVVYKKLEDAEKAATGDDKYKENGLIRENKVQYFIRKAEFHAKLIEKRNKKREEKQAKYGDDAIKNGDDDKKVDVKMENDDEDDKDEKIRPFAVLKLIDIPTDLNSMRIKDELKKFAMVEYVDVEGNMGFARFSKEGAALKVLEKLDEDKADSEEETKRYFIKLDDDQKFEIQLVTGDEEKEYWKNFRTFLSKLKSSASILKISELPEETSFGQVKDALKELYEVGYVLVEGSDAYIKYKGRQGEDILNQMKANNENGEAKITIAGKQLPVVLISGEEEKKILDKTYRNNDKRKQRNHQRSGGYKGGKRKQFHQGGRHAKKRF